MASRDARNTIAVALAVLVYLWAEYAASHEESFMGIPIPAERVVEVHDPPSLCGFPKGIDFKIEAPSSRLGGDITTYRVECGEAVVGERVESCVRVYATSERGDVQALSDGYISTCGQGWVPVPEPSVKLMLALGLCGVAVAGWMRRNDLK